MPYQPWKGLIPSSGTYSADMVTAACLLPSQVRTALMARDREAMGITSDVGNNAVLVSHSPFFSNFDPNLTQTGSGLLIDNQMMRVPMRVLISPTLSYRHNIRLVNDGRWNLFGRILHTEGRLERVHFVGNAASIARFNLNINASPLFVALRNQLGHPALPVLNRRTLIHAAPLTGALLTPHLSAGHPIASNRQMVVWIHPDGSKAHYITFRTLLDRELGYPSLCITHAKLNANHANLATLAANNAMKINVRVSGSGINHLIDFQPFLPTIQRPGRPPYPVQLQHTMIIGADVTHPGGGATLGTGSIASLVATVDLRCLVYRGAARPNPPRIEVGDV